MSRTYTNRQNVWESKLLNPVFPDLGPCKNSEYFLSNGDEYIGMYHIHLDTGARMTGANHTDKSELLYFKDEVDGRVINKLIETKYENFFNTKVFKSSSRSAGDLRKNKRTYPIRTSVNRNIYDVVKNHRNKDKI